MRSADRKPASAAAYGIICGPILGSNTGSPGTIRARYVRYWMLKERAMKLSCLQENLKRGLAIVGHAVAGKSTLPVLSHILLATDDGRLKLAATNLEVGITCWIGAKIEEEGAVTIPAKLLSDVVGGLPNDKIALALDARTQTMNLTCARFEASIKGIEADE